MKLPYTKPRCRHVTFRSTAEKLQEKQINPLYVYTGQGTKIFQYCICPAGWMTYYFHVSCKHMHLSFKSVCNKEHKGVKCNMTSSCNSSQSTHPTVRVLGMNYSSFLDFTCNYERMSGIFVTCWKLICIYCSLRSGLIWIHSVHLLPWKKNASENMQLT